jgi:hypothetical protein
MQQIQHLQVISLTLGVPQNLIRRDIKLGGTDHTYCNYALLFMVERLDVARSSVHQNQMMDMRSNMC